MSKKSTWRIGSKGAPSRGDRGGGGRIRPSDAWLSDADLARRTAKVSYLNDDVPALPDRILRSLTGPSELEFPDAVVELVGRVREAQETWRAEAETSRRRGWQNPGVRKVLLEDVELARAAYELSLAHGASTVRAALGISRQGLRDVMVAHRLPDAATHGRSQAS